MGEDAVTLTSSDVNELIDSAYKKARSEKKELSLSDAHYRFAKAFRVSSKALSSRVIPIDRTLMEDRHTRILMAYYLAIHIIIYSYRNHKKTFRACLRIFIYCNAKREWRFRRDLYYILNDFLEYPEDSDDSLIEIAMEHSQASYLFRESIGYLRDWLKWHDVSEIFSDFPCGVREIGLEDDDDGYDSNADLLSIRKAMLIDSYKFDIIH